MAFRGRADIGRASDKDGVTEHRQIVISNSDSRVSSGGDVAGDRRETLRELRGCASLNVYTIESGSALRTRGTINQSVLLDRSRSHTYRPIIQEATAQQVFLHHPSSAIVICVER